MCGKAAPPAPLRAGSACAHPMLCTPQERDAAALAAADAHEALAAGYAGLLASVHAAKVGLDAACLHHGPALAADETRACRPSHSDPAALLFL